LCGAHLQFVAKRLGEAKLDQGLGEGSLYNIEVFQEEAHVVCNILEL